MKIISHRGLWHKPLEQNTLISFKNSIDNNFGFEIDIRSFNGNLVVSHDPLNIKKKFIDFKDILTYHKKVNSDVIVAINVKEDGLNTLIKQALKEFKIKNYFVFDMSIPDMITYSKSNINFYTRQSEYEKYPALYDEASGVWLDEFYQHWIDEKIVQSHISNGKNLCIVSPDLHKRDFINEWEEYKKILFSSNQSDQLMICTDYPEKAEKFFELK
tara:strand:+ start:187 stop:831 length:645 start_codon:yes stop_codon:yes gene_type:complete